MSTLLLLSLVQTAFGCDSFSGTCATNWHCETVKDGTSTADLPVGAGLVIHASDNKVWFAMNNVRDIATDENRVQGARWDCNNNACSCPTEGAAPVDLAIFRLGFADFNTAPSITLEDETGNNRPHIMAMEEDDVKSCTTTEADARLHEWVYSSAFASLISEFDMADDAIECDIEWTHGEIGYSTVDTSLFAGVTRKIANADDEAQRASRDYGLATSWTSLTAVDYEGDRSDHIGFDFGDSGFERYIYHDFETTGPDIDAGWASSDIDLTGTAAYDWPALAYNAFASPDEWVAAMAGTDGSGDATIFMTECPETSDCETDPNDWDTTPDAEITRTVPDNVRNTELAIASDGSMHLLWVDFSGASAEPEVWYSRKCPGGSWISPVEPYDQTNWSTWLDIGRPHLALIDTANRKTVHIVLSALNQNPYSGTAPSAGDIIWAHREWSCT